jgi:hypothetical protein
MKQFNKYVVRLHNEWKQYGKIVIALDYDDTISPWKFNSPADLKQYINIIRVLKDAKNVGAYIVIFTSCNPDRYDEIRQYCSGMGIEIDTINETPVDSIPYGKNGAKVYANIYLDDRGGLNEALTTLEDAMYITRTWKVSQIKLDDVA